MDRWVLQPGSKMANYILLVCWTEIGRLLLFCEHIDIFCLFFFLPTNEYYSHPVYSTCQYKQTKYLLQMTEKCVEVMPPKSTD